MKFYKYIFSNRKFVLEAIESNCFEDIPLKSLNFKNCISSIYYGLQKSMIDLDIFKLICDKYLKELNLETLEKEERITIRSLLRWDKENV